ncbi:uncharacterized protein MAM_02126 [Metarhizium album ARSEF 1941]|uniref:Uncharacterized protein n=1 Tax=Metarhizium album (strain ARSEF 1941) TaxID=1081103 RepID=A0A0B2X374_METAS|nr:uncharacterized protein MAM_02126 [Metarhizium album ARSEF 1941]KHO00203.1 hypothetical protein MAM_02126 [Metarhizium album ARSEF 1941]
MIAVTVVQMMGTEDETGAHVIDQDSWIIEIITTMTCTTMGTVVKADIGDEKDLVVLAAAITEVDPGAGREMLGNLQIQ